MAIIVARLLSLTTITLALQACSTITGSFSTALEELYEAELIRTDFRHRVLQRRNELSKVLHVYIEGDGRPWRSPHRIALNPTPRKPLMLRLMALDDTSRIYLGRPCYFDTNDAQCNAHWWTFGRYSERVVNSMNAIIDTVINGAESVVLIGHSGGGTLAMLMAARRDDVAAVITLAGNLNVSAWTAHHNYSSLYDSLDPISQPPLPKSTKQIHYLGAKDHAILYSMLAPMVALQHNAAVVVMENQDHSCCWHLRWTEILKDLH